MGFIGANRLINSNLNLPVPIPYIMNMFAPPFMGVPPGSGRFPPMVGGRQSQSKNKPPRYSNRSQTSQTYGTQVTVYNTIPICFLLH